VVAATFVLRLAMGATTSWALDDFVYREMLAGPFSVELLTTPHGGHFSPIGLLVQWAVQHALPGRYVPLMVISALLVGLAQVGVGLWARRTYGSRSMGLALAAFLGLTTMLLELATWWSVALYAAPMVAASAWLVYFAAKYMQTGRGHVLLIACMILGLLSSVKAVILPLLVLIVAAVTPLGGASAPGYRAALRRWRSLWITLAGVIAAYGLLYLAVSDSPAVGLKSPGVYLRWVATLWTEALIPALWGGPWVWTGRFGIEDLPLTVVVVLLCLTAAAATGVYRQGATSRRVLLGWTAYVVASALLVAYGRAGFSLAGPSLRYIFDIAVPTTVLLATVVDAQRGTDRGGRGRRRLALIAAGWSLSTTVTYVYAWPQALSITTWSATVRESYPQVESGLLEQPMPSEYLLVPQRLATYLSGDKDAPEERTYVIDELLGVRCRWPPDQQQRQWDSCDTTIVLLPVHRAAGQGRRDCPEGIGARRPAHRRYRLHGLERLHHRSRSGRCGVQGRRPRRQPQAVHDR
jgi:hypothetical protein